MPKKYLCVCSLVWAPCLLSPMGAGGVGRVWQECARPTQASSGAQSSLGSHQTNTMACSVEVSRVTDLSCLDSKHPSTVLLQSQVTTVKLSVRSILYCHTVTLSVWVPLSGCKAGPRLRLFWVFSKTDHDTESWWMLFSEYEIERAEGRGWGVES